MSCINRIIYSNSPCSRNVSNMWEQKGFVYMANTCMNMMDWVISVTANSQLLYTGIHVSMVIWRKIWNAIFVLFSANHKLIEPDIKQNLWQSMVSISTAKGQEMIASCVSQGNKASRLVNLRHYDIYTLHMLQIAVKASNAVRSQQTRDIHTRLVQCWNSVVDGGPTLNELVWMFCVCWVGQPRFSYIKWG